MQTYLKTAFLSLLFAACPLLAADAVDPAVAASISSQLAAILEGQEVEKIEKTPVAGIYMVKVKGNDLFYTDESASHLFFGRLYAYRAGELSDLTEATQSRFRQQVLRGIATGDTIAFKPDGETRAVINVFTDVDCGYCRLLHQEVPKLTSKGVEVRYLAFPRGGIQSEGYRKLVSAWCADDPQSALTLLKSDKTVPFKDCKNPVADQYALGNEFGVRGTPALVLMDGTMIPGYKPAEELLELLGL
jgi:thiol:disulfide interchange protein DsbC